MEKQPITTLNDLAKHPDITTPEGMEAAMKIIRQEEFNRFCDLQAQFIFQIKDDSVREEMENALGRMRLINAE
jgi:hypothetical protein